VASPVEAEAEAAEAAEAPGRRCSERTSCATSRPWAPSEIKCDVRVLLGMFREEDDDGQEEDRERARARAERWAQTDPKMRELCERIEYHRARLAAAERRESS
jgi:hypothetical protein